MSPLARCAAVVALVVPLHAPAAPLEIEALTWTELRDRVAAGATTALVPIGGTEQNGPHMALGKHNTRVRTLALRIAERLGDALVAPVVAYVPEGSIEPPSAHMRWPGTVSIPEAAFEALLEGTAASLCRAGLRHVVLLGDHGGYRASLARVAQHFAQRGSACRVHPLPEFYRASSQGFAAWLRGKGFSEQEIGQHAGLADTALTLAVDPALVRQPIVAAGAAEGVQGDPRRASAELGREGLEQIVAVSVSAIRSARSRGTRQ